MSRLRFEGLCRATGIGSLPLVDVDEAVRAVFKFCPDLPYWPQLPKRGKCEGMNEQAIEGFPGVTFEGEKMVVRQSEAFLAAAEDLLDRYERKDASGYAVTEEYAAGLYAFLDAMPAHSPRGAKGQIAGPVTVGMSVLDEHHKPILHDPTLRELLLKHLWLKVKWQNDALARAGGEPVVFVDEPYLAASGTSSFAWGAEEIRALLEEVYSAAAVSGTHCCGNTDWSVFLKSNVDIVSFDAFAFSESFLMYSGDLVEFLSRGGNIAWGIVPTDPDDLGAVSAEELVERIEAMFDEIVRLGVARELLVRQSLVTPACGLGTRPVEAGWRALELTLEVSSALKSACRLA